MAAGDGVAGSEHHPEIDWVAAERSLEFKELVKRKRSFVVPATAFFMIWYFGFIVLAGYAPEFMGESIYEGFTVGYLFALTQFVMVWVLGAWYLRRSNREFDPLAEKAAARALQGSDGSDGDGGSARRRPQPRRFEPAEADRAEAERRVALERARTSDQTEVRR